MKSFYFPHDYSARNDQKVLAIRSEFGNEGYAVYFYLLESMAENNGPLNRGAIGGLSIGYGVTSDLLHKIVARCSEVGLFDFDDNCFWSKRMLEHLTLRKTLSDKGKEGAEARWGNRGAIRDGNAKERKGKENKVNNTTVALQKIEAWLRKSDKVKNPTAYLSKITAEFPIEIIEIAWKKAQSGNDVKTPGQFYEKCKSLTNSHSQQAK